MTLPAEFQHSYHDRLQYPHSLIPSSTVIYSTKLKSYVKRLDDTESDLCLIDGKDDVNSIFEVPVIDITTVDGTDLQQQNIHSPAKLTKWLGVGLETNANNPRMQQLVAKKRDPKCRFIYLYGQHSRDKLKITRSSLAEIFTYHQVMPAYLDFIMVFGAQSEPKDLRFSGFREQVRLRTPATALPITSLGRSGRHFQLCYNLKSVCFKKRSNEDLKLNEWSIRQAAIYHQFDVETGTALWIVTKGGDDLLERYEELIGPGGRNEDKQFGDPGLCLGSSLATHLLFCHWSTEDWRWYIRWLEEVLDHESDMAVYGPRGEGFAHRQYKPFDIQDLQRWQDRANEAVMVLESNTDVLKSIRKFYHGLVDRKDFPPMLKDGCEEDLRNFILQLDEIINDFNMQISRAKLLVNIISDRKELVLQHLQGQAADRTEELNRNLEREAVVMRIVTIVTLIYLPATFTSTFFSTDVVKYQDNNNAGGAAFSALALTRWLQVTLPLTALTLLVAWSTYKLYDTSRKGMTISQRMKSSFGAAESQPEFDKAQMLAQRDTCDTSSKDFIQRATRCLTTVLKPSYWLQSRGSALPMHTFRHSSSAA